MPVITEERFRSGYTWDDYLNAIQKNIDRFRDNYAHVDLSPDDAAFCADFRQPVNVLILAEDWCGDVVQNLPPVIRMLERSPTIAVRIFKRDENADLMDRYLTDGSRSIPYLVFLDTAFDELARWGPRPKDCQAIMQTNKGQIPMEQIYPMIREWYRTHGHGPLIREIREVLEKIASTS